MMNTLFDVTAGGAIVAALSNWLGKVWARRLMHEQVNEYDQQIEALKSKLSNEAEQYKIRLRKSEFLFHREYEAASALVALISDIDAGYADPWMDDFDAFCESYFVNELDRVQTRLSAYIATHGAILPIDIRTLLTRAQEDAVRGSFGEVAGQHSPVEFAKRCYEQLRNAQDDLVTRVHEQGNPAIVGSKTLEDV